MGTATLWGNLSQAEGLTLNLKEADLRTFINTVAEATGKNFLVDPSVKAKVTVYSGKPLDADALYQVMLSILEVHGFSAIEQGGLIKILPAQAGKIHPIPLERSDSTNKSDQLATRIFTLKHADAAKIAPLLQALSSPNNSHIFAFFRDNALIVSDLSSNLERFNHLIQKLDTPQGAAVDTVTLEHASAADLAQVLTTLLNADKRRMDSPNAPFLVADPRSNTLFIGGVPADRLHIKTLAIQMDEPQKYTGNTRVVHLKHAKAKDLLPVLTGIVADYSKSVTSTAPQAGGTAALGGGAAAPLATPVASSSSAGGPASSSKSVGNITVAEYASGNALIITAPTDLLRSLMTVIEQLDVRRAQVQVEAVIAEISTDKENELGIQWRFAPTNENASGLLGGTNFNIAGNGINSVANNPLNVGDGLSLGYMSGFSKLGPTQFINLGALIRAKAGDAINNILSTPSLVTLDNQEAKIMVGQNVPQLSGGFIAGQGGTVNPFQTYTRQDVGVILKVTPQISAGDTVQMQIEQEVSSLADVAGLQEKATNKRTINTTVIVDDRQILVLGGLITDSSQESVQKVPLLGDIPILGALFRYNQSKDAKTNLMVFLRPSIIRDAEKGWALTNERYRFMRESQRAYQREEGAVKPALPDSPLESPMLIEPHLPAVEKKQPEAQVESGVATPTPVAQPILRFGAGNDVAQ